MHCINLVQCKRQEGRPDWDGLLALRIKNHENHEESTMLLLYQNLAQCQEPETVDTSCQNRAKICV